MMNQSQLFEKLCCNSSPPTPPSTPNHDPELGLEPTPINSTLPSTVNLMGLDKIKRQRTISYMSTISTRPSLATRLNFEKIKSFLFAFSRLPILLLLLYFFICSLDFLSTSFRLMAGKSAGSIFQNESILGNPIVGLMIGVLFTVLVQSSSTCTTVIVSMVSSQILTVETAIPMIMGANIGTSLTSTLVSLTQAANKGQFELAFSGATIHDCFNWLTVFFLLSFELATGYLYNLTLWITNQMSLSDEAAEFSKNAKINILGTLTKPLTKSVIQIDKSVLTCWGEGKCQEERLLKIWCNTTKVFNDIAQISEGGKCKFLLNFEELSDLALGIILLAFSLLLLSTCLILIVKLLHSLLQGTVAELIRKTINADIPYVPWLTGYLAIIMGAVLTFIVQSSSVFTSTLTPLVGVGLITVERVYPLVLGSNLGTTTTALLACMAADEAQQFKNSVQIALCHFFFNLSGILLFYPLPFMRWPIILCKVLGRTTANYRWFAIFYLVMMFFLLPTFILLLSLAGQIVLLSVMIPILITLCLAIFINVIQSKNAEILPEFLQTWDFLPLWMHSLDPLDWLLAKFCFCSGYTTISTEEDTTKNSNIIKNNDNIPSVISNELLDKNQIENII